MCGIAGVMTKSGEAPAADLLDSMQSALAHRGPDGAGRHIQGGTGLLQTRLAIIDLETGDQPFVVDKIAGVPAALVANGEIYNYRELKAEMVDVRFQTQSDCEPPLHLYLRQGSGFANQLRGMYAIAIHDAELDRLVLSRDPFGIKPLYYVETPSVFAFASEPQALIRAGLAGVKLDHRATHELMQLQFTTGAQTPFAEIRRVLPGETLVVRAGRIIERHRIDALPAAGVVKLAEAPALEKLDDLFSESVDIHQRADVPYGMFLSGGIDSSALLVMMARLNSTPVQAFTVGFSGTGVPDERAHAKHIAGLCGAEHREIEFGETDFWRLMPRVAAAMDDPVADYATLPTYKLAEAVRAAGLKVVLSGEGGDELFGGYGRYRRAARSRLLGGRRMRASGILKGLGVLRHDEPDWRDGIAAVEAGLSRHLSGLQRAQAVDCADWLPNDLLSKLDRCLMAHGVEGRVPFVDPRLAAFAFRLSDPLKVRRRLGKWLLRKWLERHLPESQPMARKRGFTVPVGEWIAKRGDKAGTLVAAQEGIATICRPEVVRALFRGTGKQVARAQWILLFFALWHDHHVMGRRSDGDAFEALAA